MSAQRPLAAKRIVSVTFADHDHGQQHIEAVGVNGEPVHPFTRMGVDEIREQLGATPIQPFCTRDADGKEWLVRAATCHEHGCHVKTIESVSETPPGSRLIDLGDPS
jgi:hypothetical protein